MAFSLGDWNADGPSSGATGAMKRVRLAWEAAEIAADPETSLDWMQDASIGRMALAFLQGYHEELEANGAVGGVTAGGDTVTGTIT